jgi:peptide/nickel transport system substrate-binding protein
MTRWSSQVSGSRTKLSAAAFAALAAIGLIAGCGSGSSSTGRAAPVGKPTVGGTLVYALSAEPPTLDPQETSGTAPYFALLYLGGSLVARDPATGAIVPYLATSWTQSANGLHWQFKLRQGVTFSNGAPLTAADWAFTINRAIAPATASPASGPIFAGVAKATAPSPLVLDIAMSMPNASLLANISDPVFAMPLDEAYVKSVSESYLARHPVGVGPYMFKSWTAGEQITEVRNPRYTWGPSFANRGPAYIGTLKFRFLTDYTTAVQALEAGDLNVLDLEPTDVAALEKDPSVVVEKSELAGVDPLVVLNDSKPPFDNVLVRRAFSMAVNRSLLVSVAADGQGQQQQGPLSPNMTGYYPAIAQMGYAYNPAGAGKLLRQAGYSKGAGGVLELDGKPLGLTLIVVSGDPLYTRVAEILQQEYDAIGASVTIQQMDAGTLESAYTSGHFTLGLDGYAWGNSSLMFGMFYSGDIGALNESHIADPTLDKLLEAMYFATSPAANISYGDQAQAYIVRQAIAIPLFTQSNDVAITSNVHGMTVSDQNGILNIMNAYIAK